VTRRDLLLYLRDFGWEDVDRLAARTTSANETPDALAALAAQARDCRRCRLCAGRTQAVFGTGSSNARLMFIGEAPGADEDRLGEPFVGRAGQLLNAMIRAIGMRREDVYIANIVKCRPPRNRDPQADEATACAPFLRRQIELVSPDVIVVLGRIAAAHLLGTSAPLSSYRGRWRRWEGRDVLPTFHPAYLLRSPAAKAQSWTDLKQVRARLARPPEAAPSRADDHAQRSGLTDGESLL
jgi:uracil-DNA glycosylase